MESLILLRREVPVTLAAALEQQIDLWFLCFLEKTIELFFGDRRKKSVMDGSATSHRARSSEFILRSLCPNQKQMGSSPISSCHRTNKNLAIQPQQNFLFLRAYPDKINPRQHLIFLSAQTSNRFWSSVSNRPTSYYSRSAL